MDPLENYVSNFTSHKIDGIIRQIGSKYYRVSEEQEDFLNSQSKDAQFVGEFLGEFDKRNKSFLPSLTLLQIIFKFDDVKKVKLNEKGEYLFLCGRDIMGQSIVDFDKEIKTRNVVFVVNTKDEFLGCAFVLRDIDKRSKEVILNNKTDLGDYLRREKTKKKSFRR